MFIFQNQKETINCFLEENRVLAEEENRVLAENPAPAENFTQKKHRRSQKNVKKGCVYISGGRIKAIAPTDVKNAMKITHVTWQKI